MTWFLLTYDRTTRTPSIDEFQDDDAAADRFFELELEHAHDTHIEVVLLHASSIEQLHRTHSRYFTTGDMLPA